LRRKRIRENGREKREDMVQTRKIKRDADMEQLKGEGRASGPYSPVRSLKTMLSFFEMLHFSF
jgi:hypothetical protein